MRHNVYEKIKIFMIHGKKPNFSELEHRWNVDRRTVKTTYKRELAGITKDRQPMESFWSHFKDVYYYDKTFATYEDLVVGINDYVIYLQH